MTKSYNFQRFPQNNVTSRGPDIVLRESCSIVLMCSISTTKPKKALKLIWVSIISHSSEWSNPKTQVNFGKPIKKTPNDTQRSWLQMSFNKIKNLKSYLFHFTFQTFHFRSTSGYQKCFFFRRIIVWILDKKWITFINQYKNKWSTSL